LIHYTKKSKGGRPNSRGADQTQGGDAPPPERNPALWFFVSYVHFVTQQYKSRTVRKAPLLSK